MKKSRIVAIIITVLLVAIFVGIFIFNQNYTFVYGEAYDRDITALDLSGKPLEHIEDLKNLPQLKQLDLRDTGLTVEQYEQLRKDMPNCEIRWLLPFQGSYLPLDTKDLTVTQLNQEDIRLLSYLTELQTVDATAFHDYDTILSLKEQYPQLAVSYEVQVGDHKFHNNTTSITTTDIDEIRFALKYLPELELVDATDCTDFDGLVALKEQYPDCYFRYKVPYCGLFWEENTTHLDINTSDIAALDTVLAYLPEITQISIAKPVADPENIAGFVAAHPEIQLSCNVTVLGQTVPYDTTLLDIAGMQLESLDQLESILPLLPNLEKVDMCGCGYSDEEMAALNQRHPDTLFVWEVQIAYFKVRTDVTYFMPYQYRFVYTDDVVDKLKYLTELICIDMGHADISRSDFLAYMPKLQYLLICDTDITDISYCANMKDLKYVELFMTKVRDFSPLLECKNLVDLNVSYTDPEDPMVFTQMTWLENLWYRGYWGTLKHDELVKAMPNTTIVTGHGSSTALGWRRLPNYYAQRDILGMPYTEEA